MATGHISRIIMAATASTPPASLGPGSDPATLYDAYNDMLARHDRLLTLIQTKDWGFARDERVEQLQRAITGIAAILSNTDISRAEQGANEILAIIKGVMPALYPAT